MNILSPAGWLYGRIIGLRNTLYDNGILKSSSLGARTISIGNITVGGTGKTPLVALVAGILADKGEKVCILTRGYGRKNPGDRVLVSDGENVLVDARIGGDEPVELARTLLGRPVVVADADRISAAKWARDKFGITAFVLDDGFQNRKAKRDLDIVCIDATNPFGNGSVLPAGVLREPISSLGRADVIVVTRANLSANIANLKSEISELNPNAAVFSSENRVLAFVPVKEFHATTQSPRRDLNATIDQTFNVVKDRKALAFCALGNSENFFEQLRLEGVSVTGTKKFPDHHFYSKSDLKELKKQGSLTDAEIFITTAKDAVKLNGLEFDAPCFVAEIETVILEDADFRGLI